MHFKIVTHPTMTSKEMSRVNLQSPHMLIVHLPMYQWAQFTRISLSHLRKVMEYVVQNESTTASQIRMHTFSGRMLKAQWWGWLWHMVRPSWPPSWWSFLEWCSQEREESLKAYWVQLLMFSPPLSLILLLEDGEELFAAFLCSNQNSGEKPSAYLNMLHSLLTRGHFLKGGLSWKCQRPVTQRVLYTMWACPNTQHKAKRGIKAWKESEWTN